MEDDEILTEEISSEEEDEYDQDSNGAFLGGFGAWYCR